MRREDFATRIQSICERFSRATGWPMSLQPVGDLIASAVADQLRMDSTCRWFGAIGNAGAVSGFLRLDQRRSMEPQIEFSDARELATIICEFVSQTVSAFDEVDDRTQDIMTILELNKAIPAAGDMSELLNQILQAVINLTGCYSTAFFLLSPETDKLLLRHYCGPSLGSIPFATRDLRESPPDLKALQSGMVTINRDRRGNMNDWLPVQANVGICHRVESSTGPIGTLWLFDRRNLEPTELEKRVLESLSNQTAMALERAVLEQGNKEAGRLHREMNLASETQEMTRSVSNHSCNGVEVACVSTACDAVGGDLLEVIPVGDHVVFAVGDATGHSIPAAIIMSTIRGSLRALLTSKLIDIDRPDQIISHINASYSEYAATGFYMSMFLGIIDTRTGILRYSNAGHPGPILVRKDNCVTQKTHGLLLGIEGSAPYGMTSVNMKSGDLLVAYTDGITEAMDGQRKMFGSDGLQNAINENGRSSADSMMDNILIRFEEHAAGKYADDHSLLVLRAGK